MPTSEENNQLKREPPSTVKYDNEVDPATTNACISGQQDVYFRKEVADISYQALSIDNDDLISFAYQIASGMVSHNISIPFKFK